MVTDQLDQHDQRAQRDEQERDHAVEAAGLGVRPRVERPDDLAAAVGVGAAMLDRAGVADVRARAVADEPPLAVELVRPELLALGAEPVVVRLVVGEAGRAEAQRTAVGVRREPLEHEGAAGQEARRTPRRARPPASCQPRRGGLLVAHRGDALGLVRPR